MRFIGSLLFAIFAMLIAESVTSDDTDAQMPAHVNGLLVDSVVKARLAEEWSDSNRYQHAREYCLQFTVIEQPAAFGHAAVTWYRLTRVIRAWESGTSPLGIIKVSCPEGTMATLHIHTPTTCVAFTEGSGCTTGGDQANECYPSDVDLATLKKTGHPFAVIQCDKNALVPVWSDLYFR